MILRRLSGLILLGGLLTAVPQAASADALTPFVGAPCAGGVVSSETIVELLLKAEGVPLRRDIAVSYARGSLGSDAAALGLGGLLRRARTAVLEGPTRPEGGLRAEITGPNADAVSLLNGTASDFVLHCRQGDDGGSGGDAGLDWVVAAAASDADKLGVAKRDFATLSYTDDNASDEESISADIFIGFPGFGTGLGPDIGLRPFLAYQRRTSASDPLNDLTFGLTALKRFDGNEIAASLEYETDDDLEAEVWRAQVGFFPAFADICARETVETGAQARGLRCIFGLYADVVDVSDPGDKADLLTLTQFKRIGAGLNLLYWQTVPTGGQLSVQANYDIRETWDGEGGDAALGTVSLSYLPEPDSPVSFTVEYSDGEDLTSLKRSESVKIAIGYRH